MNTKTTWRCLALLVALPVLPAAAQNADEPAETAWSPARDIGVFVFPKNKQDAQQQMKDEGECYDAAMAQSGVDPKKPPPTAPSAKEQQAAAAAAAQNAPQAQGGRLRGAAKGAAVGAVGGAIFGSPGAGAGVGAVAGTVAGGSRQRQANAQAQQQAANNAVAQQKRAAAKAKAAHEEGLDNFQRAFGACLDARGYSVK
jgi:uncharacterized protein YcfJ